LRDKSCLSKAVCLAHLYLGPWQLTSSMAMQVNEVLENLLQQLQAHNHPHAGAVQAAINLAGTAAPGQKGLYASQVTPPPSAFCCLHAVVC